VVADLNHTIARNNHNPMELASTVASWDGDRLTVWDKVQGIVSAQEAYAEAFRIAQEQVRVISPFVGGGSVFSVASCERGATSAT
jgi:xanthine dehydrogenase YagR molybdenum-binding subunit